MARDVRHGKRERPGGVLMHRYLFECPEPLFKRLVHVSESERKSIAWVIEKACRSYLTIANRLGNNSVDKGDSDEALVIADLHRDIGDSKALREKALFLLSNLGDNRSDKDKARSIGVSTTKLRKWKHEPSFMKELHKLIDADIWAHRDRVIQKLIRNAAEEGNSQDIRTFLTITGDYIPTSRSMNVNVRANVFDVPSVSSPREKQLRLAKVLASSGFSTEEYRRIAEGGSELPMIEGKVEDDSH